MKHINILISFLLIAPVFVSCCDDKDEDESPAGKISMDFLHHVEGQPLLFDTMMYVNAAGNAYMVNEIQYFISDIVLHHSGGSSVHIDDWQDIYYVDTDIPPTLTWQVFDKIPEGDYTGISFTFGINEVQNVNGLFVNPPERDMFWPDALGGGFHYMKLNGKWLSLSGQVLPFNFHLGIGREITATDTVFHQNYFRVDLPFSAFHVSRDSTTSLGLVMNVESWFESPHIWDHDSIGGAIMENQSALQWAKENGWDVFTFTK